MKGNKRQRHKTTAVNARLIFLNFSGDMGASLIDCISDGFLLFSSSESLNCHLKNITSKRKKYTRNTAAVGIEREINEAESFMDEFIITPAMNAVKSIAANAPAKTKSVPRNALRKPFFFIFYLSALMGLSIFAKAP